jgi:selenocysteine lyase/cysteine desulfurase
MDKREFLRTASAASLGVALSDIAPLFAEVAHVEPAELAQDEAFWAAIRAKYRLKPDYINLENGYYCMQPQEVLEAFIGHVREINLEASYYMRTKQYPNKDAVRARLAGLAGCSSDELIITRNTTESLDTVIAGFDWKPGDEAVMAEQDYGAMLDQFDLQARRYGMLNRRVSLPLDPKSDEEIVDLYAMHINYKTRLLMVGHMVNITGHILPVKKLADMAHSKNVQIMVDGAHAFAHLDFKIPDLNCDYYAASLHKWLGAPLGAGILYVRKDRIEKLWPIYADKSMADTDIRKLNHTGTHPVHTDLGIMDAIAFQETIGIAKKEARLRYIQNYWTGQVRGLPRIKLNTPTDPRRSCGIANVGITGVAPKDLATTLLEKYRIWTVAINTANVQGVRITPNLYTTTAELDTFVRALKEIAAA